MFHVLITPVIFWYCWYFDTNMKRNGSPYQKLKGSGIELSDSPNSGQEPLIFYICK